jgi:hypothetical protein
MPVYVLSTQQPDGPPQADLDVEQLARDVAALEQQMKTAGVWVFNGHLQPPDTAAVVRADGDEVSTTEGPYSDADEHVGGLAVVNVSDRDAALDWARRMASATRLPVEVRPFQPTALG